MTYDLKSLETSASLSVTVTGHYTILLYFNNIHNIIVKSSVKSYFHYILYTQLVISRYSLVTGGHWWPGAWLRLSN